MNEFGWLWFPTMAWIKGPIIQDLFLGWVENERYESSVNTLSEYQLREKVRQKGKPWNLYPAIQLKKLCLNIEEILSFQNWRIRINNWPNVNVVKSVKGIKNRNSWVMKIELLKFREYFIRHSVRFKTTLMGDLNCINWWLFIVSKGCILVNIKIFFEIFKKFSRCKQNPIGFFTSNQEYRGEGYRIKKKKFEENWFR